MNKENLQKMADYIRTVPQKKFDMEIYRVGSHKTAECGSIGCVIGHCTVLDSEPLPMGAWRSDGEGIDFATWSEKFTGLSTTSDEWDWCFSSGWSHFDNTPEGAAKRIEWLINKGLPKDWFKQMGGENPLCYQEL